MEFWRSITNALLLSLLTSVQSLKLSSGEAMNQQGVKQRSRWRDDQRPWQRCEEAS